MDEPLNEFEADAWQASMAAPKAGPFDGRIIFGPLFYIAFGLTSWPLFVFGLCWIAYFVTIVTMNLTPTSALRRLRSAAFGGIRTNYSLNRTRSRFLGEEK